MQPYLNSYPEPDTTNIDSAADKRRGAFFNFGGGSFYIYMMLSGTSTCPDMAISHYNNGASDTVRDGGINCIYQF